MAADRRVAENEAESAGLVRGLGSIDVALITVGSTLGSAIFLAAGDAARSVPHPGWLLALWVAGGLYGSVETSDDRMDWTARYTGGFSWYNLRALGYGAGTFVAAGESGKLMTSTDGGVHWSKESTGTSSNLYGLGFGPGMWVLPGY